MGATSGELKDRHFVMIDGKNNIMSGREFSKMVLIDCDVKDGCLHLGYPDHGVVTVNLEETVHIGQVRRAMRVLFYSRDSFNFHSKISFYRMR
jgi:hypothetical protein